tara:strand:- start:53 stop:412 length:360 start_codon:yes stop_codon:yes gene_type:complete
MKLFAILPAVLIAAAPVVSAQEVDPGFGVEEPRPINVARRNGVNPIARFLFFPILPFVELQSELSPEKASCWNDRADEVAGCSVVEQVETAKERRGARREERREVIKEKIENRPTPYSF